MFKSSLYFYSNTKCGICFFQSKSNIIIFLVASHRYGHRRSNVCYTSYYFIPWTAQFLSTPLYQTSLCDTKNRPFIPKDCVAFAYIQIALCGQTGEKREQTVLAAVLLHVYLIFFEKYTTENFRHFCSSRVLRQNFNGSLLCALRSAVRTRFFVHCDIH